MEQEHEMSLLHKNDYVAPCKDSGQAHQDTKQTPAAPSKAKVISFCGN